MFFKEFSSAPSLYLFDQKYSKMCEILWNIFTIENNCFLFEYLKKKYSCDQG